jgi:hypothetical protein
MPTACRFRKRRVRFVGVKARVAVVHRLVQREMLADQQLAGDARGEELVEVIVDVFCVLRRVQQALAAHLRIQMQMKIRESEGTLRNVTYPHQILSISLNR